MNQSEVVTRIEEICKEFDGRVEVVGLAIARLELAKALAEAESAQQGVQWIGLEPGVHKVQCSHCCEFTSFEVPNRQPLTQTVTPS